MTSPRLIDVVTAMDQAERTIRCARLEYMASEGLLVEMTVRRLEGPRPTPPERRTLGRMARQRLRRIRRA